MAADLAEVLERIDERLSRLERLVESGGGQTDYLDARQAAAYLNISYSTFRKRRKFIRRVPQNKKFRREDLDEYAESLKPRRKK